MSPSYKMIYRHTNIEYAFVLFFPEKLSIKIEKVFSTCPPIMLYEIFVVRFSGLTQGVHFNFGAAGRGDLS